MEYRKSKKYESEEWMAKIMGPNPIKLTEELLLDCRIPRGAVVCDLGSGQGLTSVFMAKEYGFCVYAADLWSDPEENRTFFHHMGLTEEQIIPVKADAASRMVMIICQKNCCCRGHRSRWIICMMWPIGRLWSAVVRGQK